MGRMLGSFDDTEDLDRPDLNKCPDCDCYFEDDACPLCGKPCPEEFRAGNRAAVKRKKRSRAGNGRVVFVSWYHRWWFILLMLFAFPVLGIVLLLTSPHKTWVKVLVTVLFAVYTVAGSIGLPSLISRYLTPDEEPVNTALSEEDYKAGCETPATEEFYRNPDLYVDRYVRLSLTVCEKFLDGDAYYDGYESVTYYLCRDENGGPYEILIRDCRRENQTNLIEGDRITVYGEGQGNRTVNDLTDFRPHSAPCLNAAYIETEE